MITVHDALAEASRLRAAITSPTGYAVAYGSHATDHAGRDSDLDLLFIGPGLSAEHIAELVRAVVALHHDHGLRLDTEVAHEVKLHATHAEVGAALRLAGFSMSPTGELRIPPVVVEPWFLNSTPFKLRLILNALTTPHVFLGGDVDRYRQHCATADRAVALLALAVLDPVTEFTVVDAARALVTGPDGATGEDFLGYTPGVHLHSVLQRGLADLVCERVVNEVDGATLRQDPEQRCRLLTGLLAPPTPKPVAAPGTMSAEQGGCQVDQR